MTPDHMESPAAAPAERQATGPDGRGPATPPGSPGEVLLRLFMAPLGLTAYRVSTDLGVPPIAISEILRGRRAISPAMATRLGVYFGVEPHFWLALQSAYELRLALQGTGADGNHQSNGVSRCNALLDRQFVIRESKNGTDRHYEVILVKVRMTATNRPTAATTAQPTKQAPPGKPAAKNKRK